MRVYLILVATTLLFVSNLFGQDPNHKAYFLDLYMKPTDSLDNAHYLLVVEKEHDSLFHHWYYHYTSKQKTLFEYQSYKDEQGAVENGYFAWYNDKGMIDSSGFIKNNIRDGNWYYYDPKKDLANPTIVKYENGVLLPPIPPKKDEKTVDTNEYYEPRSKFNWVSYLERNLQYPKIAESQRTQGVVIVDFIVSMTGNVTDVTLAKSVDYFLDTEAIRVIKSTSGKWKPGKINGVACKTYHQQKIHFGLPD